MLIIAFLFAIMACRSVPPRSSLFPSPEKPQLTFYSPTKLPEHSQSSAIDTISIRVQAPSDETFASVQTSPFYDPSSRSHLLETAITQIENGNIDNGCAKIREFLSSSPPPDSLYFEAKFYEAECAIQNNKLNAALDLLLQLQKDHRIPNLLWQKTTVRIGQVYCVLNNRGRAQYYFQLVLSRFPDSPYRAVATCDAVLQK